MTQESNATNGMPSMPNPQEESYRWLKCDGCSGKIGIPSDWTESTVECPKCEMVVRVKGSVLYRPSDQAGTSRVTGPISQTQAPSLDLIRKADRVLIMGILSIVLGWTILVPLFTLGEYNEASSMAKKEQVLTPGKATVGLVLALLFGVVQALTVVLPVLRAWLSY